MTNKLRACVCIPHLAVQVARAAASVAPATPLIVATSRADRGRVLDGCPLALAHGITAGMSVWEARDCAPGLAVALDDQDATGQAAGPLRQVLAHYSDRVTPLAADCWLLIVYALGWRYQHAEAIAERLYTEIEATTGWTCAVGMGSSATIATMAVHQLHAQDQHGYTVVLPGAEAAFLDRLPVRNLLGVGEQTERQLAQMGIATVGQLRALPDEVLYRLWGRRGQQIALRARGQDPGPERVTPERWCATWHFADGPCPDPIALRAVTHILSERVGRRLRAEGLGAGTLLVQLIWSDGLQHQLATTLQPRRDLDAELGHAATRAFDQLFHARRGPVAQIAVIAADIGPRQADLLTADERRPWQLQRALDRIKARWGTGAILTRPLIGSPIQGRRKQPQRTRA